MNARLLAVAAALAGLLGLWWAQAGAPRRRAALPAEARPAPVGWMAGDARREPPRDREDAEVATRRREELQRELLRQEIDLEQLRYGAGYWEAELAPADGAVIEEARAELRAALARELGSAEALTAYFGPEQAAPCLRFLDAAARERLLEAFARAAHDAPLTTATMLEAARACLSPDDFARYREWNAPEAVALRESLAGFAPTQGEFDAIRSWTTPEGVAEDALRTALGAERFAAWRAQNEPEMQTALREIRRLGGDTADAEWLRAERGRLIAALGAVWSDPSLPDEAKAARAAALKRAGREALAARWASGDPAAADFDLLP